MIEQSNSFNYGNYNSGADEEIRGWVWETIEAEIPNNQQNVIITVGHDFQFQCDIQIGARQLAMPRTETNALIYHDNMLYSGGGDGIIYQWDVSTERLVAKLKQQNQEHGKYVMSLNHTSANIFSGYSDGQVKIWDVKSNNVVRTMSPLTGESDISGDSKVKLQKPSWISSIAIDDNQNWMAIGGGACYATLWYIPQMTMMAVMPTSATINDICITNDQIVTVGNERNITFWERDGRFRTRVSSDITALFSVQQIHGGDTESFAVSGLGSHVGLVIHDRINNLKF